MDSTHHFDFAESEMGDDTSVTYDSEVFSTTVPESTASYIKDLEEQLFSVRDKLSAAEDVWLEMRKALRSIDNAVADIKRVSQRQEERSRQLVGAQLSTLNAGNLAASNPMSSDKRALATPSKRPVRETRDTEAPSAIECLEKLTLTTPLSSLKLKLLLDDRRQGRSLQKAAQSFTEDIEGLMRQLNCLKEMLKQKKSSMHLARADDFDAAHLLSRLEKLTSNHQPQ